MKALSLLLMTAVSGALIAAGANADDRLIDPNQASPADINKAAGQVLADLGLITEDSANRSPAPTAGGISKYMEIDEFYLFTSQASPSANGRLTFHREIYIVDNRGSDTAIIGYLRFLPDNGQQRSRVDGNGVLHVFLPNDQFDTIWDGLNNPDIDHRAVLIGYWGEHMWASVQLGNK